MIQPKSKSNLRAGFTLFELLVSISIIVIIIGIAVYNHKRFDTDLEITNVAYRIALSLRQAQVYSISVKQFSNIQKFDLPYGVHFAKKNDTSFLIFAEADGNKLYNGGPGGDADCVTGGNSECLEKTSLNRGIKIKGWCGIPGDDSSCFFNDSSSSGQQKHFLDIFFKRPNPDANYNLYQNSYTTVNLISTPTCSYSGQAVSCTGWAICLISPEGRQKRVVVYQTGQISVENVDPGTTCNNPVAGVPFQIDNPNQVPGNTDPGLGG